MNVMYKLIGLLACCFFAFIVWIIYLANTGGDSIFFEFVKAIPYGDKLGHFGLFGCLTLVAVLGLRFRSFALGRFRIYYGAALVFMFATGEEFSQAFVPSRTFDLIDLAADLTGIIMAVTVSYWASKYMLKRSISTL